MASKTHARPSPAHQQFTKQPTMAQALQSQQFTRERKHLPRMFSLIKNESRRFEEDHIPS
uniref:Uncharacterized protein n=1 Tax=Erpetoichthys calabaricus TaxID=27687 RepID=A0A8C4XEX9_ERPCA